MVGTGCFNVLHITVNPLPASITGPSQVCEHSVIALGNTSTPGIWISSNTSVATIGYISGILTGASAGTVMITYTLPTGCIATKLITVNVTPPAITGSGYICQESTVLLSNTMPGGVWHSSNPGVATIGAATGLVTPVTLGTSIISYTLPVTGCQATKMVTVSPLPIVYTVTGGGTYCAGGNGVHIGLTNSQSGVSYALYYGTSATGYATGTGAPIDFGFLTMAGLYTVNATYAQSGCTRDMSGSATVVITPLTPPTVSINTGSGDSSCPGTVVNLVAATPSGGTSPLYLWSVNGVNVSTAPGYSFVPADGDVVGLKLTSNASCILGNTAVTSKTLHVLPFATPVVAALATPGDSVCQFSPVTFTAVPTYGGASPSYTWMVNGVTAGTGSTYSYVPVQGDAVSVSMVSNYLCRLANSVTSSAVPMTVDSIIIPHVSISTDSGLVTTPGNPVVLHATATKAGPNPTYQWKVNGHPIPGATNANFTYTFHDYDSVNCMVVSSGACHNIGTFDWVFIAVWPEGVQSVTGAGSDIKLVPNPNKGQFTVKGTLGTADETVTLDVTDMLGQVVFRGSTEVVRGHINAAIQLGNNLANGMYILTVHSASGQNIFHFVMEQ
jgi:hypothetical protein